MTTTLLDGPHTGHPLPAPDSRAPRGFWSWALALDHKRVALMYLVGTLGALAAGAFLAVLMRADLATPESDLGPTMYNRLFSLHGVLMMFVFAIPAIPATLGNYFLPLLIGARGMAFPRLNRAAFHLWALGTVLLLAAITVGSLDTGWTFYTPYALAGESGTPVILAALGALSIALSTLVTGLGFVVTVHKLRAPGMTWRRLPMFVVTLYAASLVAIAATPALFVTLVMLVLEHGMGVGLFAPTLGGDPVLFQHFFWFYAHPVGNALALPAFGIVAEVVAVHARRRLYGARAMVLSVAVLALAGFLQWGQHMFVSGQSEAASAFFSFTSLVGAAPFFVLVACLVMTLRGGVVHLTTPMLYALAFILLLALGGLAGLPLAALATGVHLHNSSFVTGHVHLVLMAMLMALLAGLHHWFPKMFGRVYDERHGRLGALAVTLGAALMGLAELVMGSQGMARRMAAYNPDFQGYHLLAGAGGLLVVLGLLWTLAYLVLALRWGPRAEPNPWGGASLEWATTSPPPDDNFTATPHVDHDPYTYPEEDRA